MQEFFSIVKDERWNLRIEMDLRLIDSNSFSFVKNKDRVVLVDERRDSPKSRFMVEGFSAPCEY